MIESYKIKWFYIISLTFIAIFSLGIAYEFFWVGLLPLVLCLIFLYIFRLDNVFFLITFLTPLSINVSDKSFNVAIILPTEPLLIGLMLIFILKTFIDEYEKSIYKHPVTIAIIFNLIWIFITSITSTYPVVSFKFLLARLWFVIPSFFFAILLFKEEKNIFKFFWAYLISLVAVVIYILIDFTSKGLDQKVANWIVAPFFNDHTSYGAVLAMYIPISLFFIFYYKNSPFKRFVSIIFSIILIIALILSYTRAAWVSMFAGIILFFIVYFKIKLRYIIVGFTLLVTFIILQQNEFFYKLEKNKSESSTDFVQHLRSISNISSDASNLERLNRWSAALRMFKDKPFLGFGPGTYQMNYAPYQLSREKTIISTNAGDRGNAHSEYLGPLSESGLIGMLSFISIVLLTLYTGIKNYIKNNNKTLKNISLTLTISYFTYVVHGIMNNFLDTDKASIPFWGFTAIIVCIDLFYNNTNSNLADRNQKTDTT